jgi:phosphoadenosine phosphosulfate reductase
MLNPLPLHEARLPDAAELEEIGTRLRGEFAALDLPERLAALRRAIGGRIVFTTSFGLEDQAIGHTIFTQRPAIEVVTLDTGRLFAETHQVWAETERRYGQKIRALVPDQRALESLIARQGIDGFRSSVDARLACCRVRKVEPLDRALVGASSWITGLRAEQSPERARASFCEFDSVRSLLKVNPLLDWTRGELLDYVRSHRIPYNPLHDRGFLSIGCAPCTRAVAPGEPERAGRWWWEQEEKKECGLHLRRDRDEIGPSAVSG